MNRRKAAADQSDLAGRGYENRSLFSENFLERRLPEWTAFKGIEVGDALDRLSAVWEREKATITSANEAQTEERLIQPILDVLGFEKVVQADSRLSTGRRIPDYALFTSLEDRQFAEQEEGVAKFERAVALAEAKAFSVPLDKKRAGAGPMEDPEAQVLDYMWRTRVRWAILTNGREWRLYGQAGDLVEASHFAIRDLPNLIEARDKSELRYFLALFSAQSFQEDSLGVSFADRALAESEANATAIGDTLKDQVFEALPKVAAGLLGDDQRDAHTLADAYANSLVVLYRLLFCLYAESRDLLPIGNPAYANYSLRRWSKEIRDSANAGSHLAPRIYRDLEVLFGLVDQGEKELGINAYNGGLFSEDAHPWLTGRAVPDAPMIEALRSLFEIDGIAIDYRDLSIRHLGAIYEHLLAFQLGEVAGQVELIEAEERHSSGSYFTPEPIVDAIVERTLDPILTTKSLDLQSSEVSGGAAIEAFLAIGVCDPAMGSGHFLVSAATYISRFIATDPSQEGENVDELSIRRSVTERCLYGVDLNPMAVELARLALWLTSVDGTRPLTFLANLRVGNSLVGAEIDDLRKDITYLTRIDVSTQKILDADKEIRSLTSETAAQVSKKKEISEDANHVRADIDAFVNETIKPYFSDENVDHIFNWEIEYPEVFMSKKPDSGFDAIIGNPPYVRIQEIERSLASFIRKKYDTAFGSFDLYQVFIERSYGLLRSGGRLGFIVPNKFLKLEAAEKLRDRLSEGRLVDTIIDFGDQQIFPDATNYTCILELSASPSDEVSYKKIDDHGRVPVSADIDRTPSESFSWSGLGANPWVLVPCRERSILEQCQRDTASLAECTKAIFTGIQTSADKVYILEDRGLTSNGRRLYSKALDREVVLESDLLQPLASGGDIERWSIKPLKSYLLFPYRRSAEGLMQLLTIGELQRLPRTLDYLQANENQLRQRENGKMDHEDWYAFGRTQSLGLHDQPKLGVPRMCLRLHAGIDSDGESYLDNVDVNGIIPGPEVTVWCLAGLMHSRLLDFLFRRGSVPFRGSYWSANKQFIAWLPIMVPTGQEAGELESVARSVYAASKDVLRERAGFVDWLEKWIGVRGSELAGSKGLAEFDRIGADGLHSILRKNRKRIEIDVDSRDFGDSIASEYEQSVERIAGHSRIVELLEPELEDRVYELYGLSTSQRAIVDAEYEL
ncbi:MAG TPA: N-6 DNA methylase [Solirubrobacterales bacterium]|nr:N-6 DNA methylase [Solirubrobacterales bacterium]